MNGYDDVDDDRVALGTGVFPLGSVPPHALPADVLLPAGCDGLGGYCEEPPMEIPGLLDAGEAGSAEPLDPETSPWPAEPALLSMTSAIETEFPVASAPVLDVPPDLADALVQALERDLLRFWGPPPQDECGEIGVGAKLQEDFYGDGSDGDWDITMGYALPSPRDYYIRNLTIRTTATLYVLQRIFVSGRLTIESGGKLSASGGAGGDALAGGGGGAGSSGDSMGGARYPNAWKCRAGDGGAGGSTAATGSASGTLGGAGTGQSAFKAGGPLTFLAGCGGGGGAYLGSAAGAAEASAGGSIYGADGGAGGAAVSDGSSVQLGGGVRDLEQMKAMVAAGATRIGASAGVRIVKESRGEAAAGKASGY